MNEKIERALEEMRRQKQTNPNINAFSDFCDATKGDDKNPNMYEYSRRRIEKARKND